MVFYFPDRLGCLKVVQFKQKIKLLDNGTLDKRRLRANWKATKELWSRLYPDKSWKEIVAIKDKPIVYHENKHSSGLNYRWRWDKSTAYVKNCTVYRLNISRTNDRKLAKALKNRDLNLYYSTK